MKNKVCRTILKLALFLIDSSLTTTISSIAPLIADEGLKLHTNQTKNGKRGYLIKSLVSNIQKLLLFKMRDNSFSDHHNMTSMWYVSKFIFAVFH